MQIPNAGKSNTVTGNKIGTDGAGTATLANGQSGVVIDGGSHDNTIGPDNVISGNTYNGVNIKGTGSNTNIVSGNLIGTKSDHTKALANGQVGVLIEDGAQNNKIQDENVISGNTWSGVKIAGSNTTGNLISKNFIGTDKSGAVDVGNATRGVLIDGAKSNQVYDNTISGNDQHGVHLTNTRIRQRATPKQDWRHSCRNC